MGSNMKPTIFNERVAKALRTWHQTARKQIKKNRHSGSVTPISSSPSTPLHGSSPAHLLRYYKNENELNSLPNSPRISNYKIESWQAEQDDVYQRSSVRELVEEEMEILELPIPLSSEANNFDLEINVTDFSFDKTLSL